MREFENKNYEILQKLNVFVSNLDNFIEDKRLVYDDEVIIQGICCVLCNIAQVENIDNKFFLERIQLIWEGMESVKRDEGFELFLGESNSESES